MSSPSASPVTPSPMRRVPCELSACWGMENGRVHYIVQESHGHLHRLLERPDLQPSLWLERKAYETGEIDRAKIACAIRGERDFSADSWR